MEQIQINYSKEPIRLFKSDFLEFFTHIHPAVVVVIWLPVSLIFLFSAIANIPAGASPLYIPAGFLVGLFVWTLTEYVVHRFVFHYHPKSEAAKRFSSCSTACTTPSPTARRAWSCRPAVSIPGAFAGVSRLLRRSWV